MTIGTVFACPEELRCIFDDETSGNTLDLTDLSGEMIKYINNDSLSYSFEYTVCKNNLDCQTDGDSMAIRWDISTQSCDRKLAIWNGYNGYDLSYDDTSGVKQWKFSYSNGDYCQVTRRNTEFNIYWRCNSSVSSWIVTDTDTVNQCDFSMYIDSKYAC